MKTITLIIALITIAHTQSTSTITVIDSLIRPANVVPYSANDVVNDSLSSANKLFRFDDVVTTKGAGGYIVNALLVVDTPKTTNGNFKLLLFNDTVANAADNAAWVGSAVNAKYLVGEIDFALTTNSTAAGTAAYASVTGVNIGFNTLASRKRLYGVLLAKAAYAPMSRQKFIVKLNILRNQ